MWILCVEFVETSLFGYSNNLIVMYTTREQIMHVAATVYKLHVLIYSVHYCLILYRLQILYNVIMTFDIIVFL